MEMEHINENLIKVLIDTQDLAERGINFLDLIGDQSLIEKFFYSILEEVDVDQHFQESEAVTFQVMPNKDGLELYISRNNFDEIETIWEDEISKRLLERKKQSKVNRQRAKASKYEELAGNSKGKDSERIISGQLIRFADLESFLKAARAMKAVTDSNTLFAMNNAYYLRVDSQDAEIMNHLEASHPLWQLLEYGEVDQVTSEVLIEHGQVIKEDNALEFFAQRF